MGRDLGEDDICLPGYLAQIYYCYRFATVSITTSYTVHFPIIFGQNFEKIEITINTVPLSAHLNTSLEAACVKCVNFLLVELNTIILC